MSTEGEQAQQNVHMNDSGIQAEVKAGSSARSA